MHFKSADIQVVRESDLAFDLFLGSYSTKEIQQPCVVLKLPYIRSPPFAPIALFTLPHVLFLFYNNDNFIILYTIFTTVEKIHF